MPVAEGVVLDVAQRDAGLTVILRPTATVAALLNALKQHVDLRGLIVVGQQLDVLVKLLRFDRDAKRVVVLSILISTLLQPKLVFV